MKRASFALLVGLGACAGAGAGCEDTTPPVPCVNAPPAGCPDDFGADVCQDPSCTAVYTCKDGKWVFERSCGPRDSGAEASTAIDAGLDLRDAAAGADAPGEIDAPNGAFGGPGCIALQEPDCPLGVALACMPGGDCCGCQDLFVCTDGGWDPWGVCADGGVVPR